MSTSRCLPCNAAKQHGYVSGSASRLASSSARVIVGVPACMGVRELLCGNGRGHRGMFMINMITLLAGTLVYQPGSNGISRRMGPGLVDPRDLGVADG